jgi:hypothetical protein
MANQRALVNIGIDVGQVNDPTAVAAVMVYGPAQQLVAHVKHLERLPLRTSYPDVVRRVQGVLFNLNNVLFAEGVASSKVSVLVDITGIGRAIYDMLREPQTLPAAVRLVAVTLTGGAEGSRQGDDWKVPKQDFDSNLIRFSAERRLYLPATEEATQFQRELRAYQGRKTSPNRIETGARAGSHDDLIIAVGLALLNVAHVRKPTRQRQAIFVGGVDDKPRPVKGLRRYRGMRLYDDGEFR